MNYIQNPPHSLAKDYDGRNERKKALDMDEINVYAKPRDICYVQLGVNVGVEQNGKANYTRPVLIISKIGSLYFVIPLTTKEKTNHFHHKLTSIQFPDIVSSLILSQGKVIDPRRLYKKIGHISVEEYGVITKKLQELYLPVL